MSVCGHPVTTMRSCRDLVVPDEVVAHRVVLDDVRVAEGRDDALADGVVPARHVRDDREAEAPRADEERDARVRLDVREHERSALRLAFAGRARAARSGVDRSASPPSPARRAPSAEARCRGPSRASSSGGRAHPLRVEAVAPVQAHRERVVAELPVEQRGRCACSTRSPRADLEPARGRPVQHPPAHARRPVRALRAVR